jgi:hypothetical protein
MGAASASGREEPCGADVLGGVGEERHVACPLHGLSELALVTSADAGLASRFDLSSVGHEASKARRVFVVNGLNLIDTELADPALGHVTPSSAATRAAISRGAISRFAIGDGTIGPCLAFGRGAIGGPGFGLRGRGSFGRCFRSSRRYFLVWHGGGVFLNE